MIACLNVLFDELRAKWSRFMSKGSLRYSTVISSLRNIYHEDWPEILRKVLSTTIIKGYQALGMLPVTIIVMVKDIWHNVFNLKCLHPHIFFDASKVCDKILRQEVNKIEKLLSY